MTEQELLEGLNPSQIRAVHDTEGRILVMAGAGSGKTAVLTRRVAYLRMQSVPAWQILVVTFTNKAAREMKERINKYSNGDAKDAWVGTFHSICLRILTRFGKELGYEKFTLIDGDDQLKLVKELIKLMGYEYEHKDVLSAISGWKNDMKEPGDIISTASFQEDKDMAQVYQAYEDKKKELLYFDFDDLLLNVVRLFVARPDIAGIYQNQFRYILVDEFQDTNDVQFKLIDILSERHGNVFLVGDADQSIYKFRKAKIENILNYQTLYPETKVHKLEENYRSTHTIVNAANAVVENNQMRLDRTAISQGEPGDPILMFRGDDDSREADFVANMVSRIHKKENRPYKDFAVLYRTNRQSRAVEMALTQFGIPYKVVNGHAFYARKEIKDLVSYMRAIDNGVDDISFERIINVPKRGIGKTTIDRISAYAEDCGIPFAKAIENVESVPKLTKKAVASIKEFNALMVGLREFALSPEFTVLDMMKKILHDTDFYSQYDATKEDDESRIENIQELMNVAGQWDTEEKEINTLTQFLTETSLASSGEEDDEDVVTLTSVHGAKGLEWSHVFVVGLEEGIFPHGRAYNDPADMEEERRLMYVAMTRPADRLFLSWAKARFEYGNPRPIPTKPSIFLKEIPAQYVYRLGC
jgi:DNA helicase-2/ATP-dependent DNA helicase PcrA